MNVLVTGGAGYIGSHTVCHLLDSGHTVTILDNLSTGHKQNADPRAQLVVGDVSDLGLLNRLLGQGVEAVFHFAALKSVGESMEHPERYTRSNLIQTLQLLDAMLANNVGAFVFSSSAATYGSPEYLPVDEDHPTRPMNYYGFTKLMIEQTLHWYSSTRNLRFAALRYFNAAGYDIQKRISGKEKNPANLLPVVMEVAAGTRSSMQVFGNDYPTSDGTCIRDYIHVNDLASAHVKAMEYLVEKRKDLVLNLATGEGYSVLEVIRMAEKISGRTIAYRVAGRRDGDPPELIATSVRARELIGWKAKHSNLDEILSSMWQVYC